MLGELRIILHQDVVLFGCSATLDNEAERLVLASAGFRPVGRHLYQTEVLSGPPSIALMLPFASDRCPEGKQIQRAPKKTSDAAGKQYTTDSTNEAYCVSTIIEEFTAHVSLYDRDIRYNEFKMPSSLIRIMLATTSLGMGINISDVDGVVLWKFPIGSGSDVVDEAVVEPARRISSYHDRLLKGADKPG
ncbi:hypothetical protein Egran_01973 [Elaphomyces granulatus]|uniref:Helicase C-terminal domain-containing protein n=1 Tax=Elaphomyces granulatus TaxID=519963 RepID=A0A232M2F7_9EURO|nr:hypothetical protein Egran_01973 [Elaphomyces granulatus]